MSGQLHASAALPLGNPARTGYEGGRAPEPVAHVLFPLDDDDDVTTAKVNIF
jgi:hypothetical protein